MSSRFDEKLFSFLRSLKKYDFAPVYIWTLPISTPRGLIPCECLMIYDKSDVNKFIKEFTGYEKQIDCIQLANETIRF